MKKTPTENREPRILGRRLAKELSSDELERAVAGCGTISLVNGNIPNDCDGPPEY